MIEQWAMAELRELEARLSNVIEGLQAEVEDAEALAPLSPRQREVRRRVLEEDRKARLAMDAGAILLANEEARRTR